MNHKYLGVVTRSHRAREIPAYLYSTAEVVEQHEIRGLRTAFVVEIATTREDCGFVADYQADRLMSGNHAAKPFDRREDAERFAFGYDRVKVVASDAGHTEPVE